MTREQELEQMIAKIVDRAGRAKKTGSTEIHTQEVPAALITAAAIMIGRRG